MKNNFMIMLITSVLTCIITIFVIFSMKTAEAEITVGQNQVQIPGIIEAYSGSDIPDGYLLCDGREISRTDYSELFNIIGTTYGAGDGTL